MKLSDIISVLGFIFMVITLLAKKDTFTLRLKCIVAKLACAVVMLRGACAITGHLIENEKLTKWFGAVPMPFSSAICFCVLALCISWIIDMLEKQNSKDGLNDRS